MGYRRNPPKGEPGHQERDPFTYAALWAMALAGLGFVVWLAVTG